MPEFYYVAKGKILVVDDERDIVELVSRYLTREGFDVIPAFTGNEAISLAQGRIDLIVLDLMIPEPDGLEVTRMLRAQSNNIPILILTARGDEIDRVMGLELGADDYLTKPFSPRELIARVKALLRRSRMPSMGSTHTGDLIIDTTARRVYRDGVPIELTPREYDLLKVLAGTPGKNFTREELLERVWGPEYPGETRRVDVHISKLREKLRQGNNPAPIRSIWGVGYRFEA